MFRPVIVWNPNEQVELVVRYQYEEVEGDGSASQAHTNGVRTDGTPVNFNRNSYDLSIDGEGFQDTESHFVSA